MDVEQINPFVNAAKHVFQTMVHLTLQTNAEELHVKKDQHGTHDVSSIIGLSGDVVGAVVLSFPHITALKIASMFAGMELTEEHEDFPDAIGELANMIAGNAKRGLDGLDISISIPSVIIGQNHVVRGGKSIPRVIIPCNTPVGSFVIEVGMQQIKQDTQQPTMVNTE